MSILENEALLFSEFLHPGGFESTCALLDILKLHTGEKVLEIGCGTGATLGLITQKIDVRLYALEHLQPMLRTAKKRLEEEKLMQKIFLFQANADMFLPFADNSFHAVYAESEIALLNPTFVNPECSRVLRSGGKLIFNERIWKSEVSLSQVKEINSTSMRAYGIPASTLIPYNRDA